MCYVTHVDRSKNKVFNEELKRALYIRKRERVHFCAEQLSFKTVFSIFHNYEEVSVSFVCFKCYFCMYHQ